MENQTESLKLLGKNFIPICEVIYLQSDINYTVIHTLDCRRHISGFSLKTWEGRIQGDTFLRINKGLLINRDFIVKVSTLKKEKFICLTNGLSLPILGENFEK
jgi:DNA-binding LytR/AlgR family response regulator